MLLAIVVAYAVLATAYSASLDVTVARTVGGGGTSQTFGNAISVLSSNNIVLSGYTNGNVAGTLVGVTEGFVRGFGPDGSVIWTNQVSTGAGGNLQFVSSAIDSSDNIYVVSRCSGSFSGVATAGETDVCLVKYNTDGNILASFLNGGTGNELTYQVAVNKADGTIYIVGATNSNGWNGQTKTGAADAFLLRYSISGSTSTLLGTYLFGVAGQDTYFYAVTVDGAGNVWAAGYTTAAAYRGSSNAGAAGSRELLIQKMSPSGTVLFSTLIGGPGIDMAYGVTTDAANSAYICGYTTSTFDGIALVGGGRDLVVVKYNSAGVKQWSQPFGGSADEGASAVTYDTINKVLLVNGYTQSASVFGLTNPNPGTQTPFLLVLDPSTGNQLSARLYPGSAVVSGSGVANNAAAVYMTGSTYGSFQGQAVSGTSSAYMLKVDRYAGAPYDLSYLALGLNPGGSTSNGYDVAMFSNGDAVLGATTNGYFEAPSTNVQFLVQRYSSASGKVQWTAEAGGLGVEQLNRIAVDRSDNTFAVGGTTSAPAVGFDVYYAKFNSTGGTVFSSQFGGSGDDSATAVAVDSTGSFFYVVGTTNSPILRGYALIGPSGDSNGYVTKIDAASGDIVRHRQFGCTPDCVTIFEAAAIDSTGSLWVAGTQGGAAYYGVSPISARDVFLQRFDSNTGSSAFVTLVGGAGDDESKTISIDANDNMYAAAISDSTTVDGQTAPGSGSSSSILVVKWNSAGTKLWTKMFGGAGSDEVYGSAVDSNRGLLYLTGQTDSATFYGATNTNSAANPFLLVLNVADGSVVYAAVYSSTSNSQGRGVATNGVSTYMVGTAVSNLLGQKGNTFMGRFLLKLVGNLPGPTAAPSRAPTAIVTRAPTGPSRVPTANPTSSFIESSIIGANPYNSYSAVYGIASFSNGDTIMAGITTGYLESPASNNYYLQFLFQRFTPSGTLVWSVEAGGSNNEFLTGVAVDVNNVAYASGFTYSASVGGSDIAYARVTQTSGTSPVATYYQYGGTGDDSAAAVAVDSTGSFFYLVGKTNSPTLSGQTLTGVVDGFVTKINAATGAIVWHRQYGCAGCTTSFSAAALDSAGNLWVTGTVQGGPYYTKASFGGKDLIIQKFSTSLGEPTFVDRVGGTGDDTGTSITIDSSNNVYASATSYSTTVDGQSTLGAGTSMLIVKWSTAGVKQWTTLFGGDGDDSVDSIAYDFATNELVVSGVTNSASIWHKDFHGHPVSFYVKVGVLTGGILVATFYSVSTMLEGDQVSAVILGIIAVGYTFVLVDAVILSNTIWSSHLPSTFHAMVLTPIVFPSLQPTLSPTFQPTRVPTRQPSRQPTSQPSRQPSSQPTSQPSVSPTNYCVKWAKDHTSAPTRQPTHLPTIAPSYKPTFTVTATPTVSPTAACISGWVSYGNKCYKTNLAISTFEACRAYCPTLRPGAGMLCIESAAQNTFIRSQITSTSWIGYTDEVTEGTWVWGAGCTSTFTQWTPNEPNNGGGSGQNYGSTYTSGNWDDITGSLSCACEYVARPSSATLPPSGRRLEEEEVTDVAVPIAAPAVSAVAARTPKLRGHSLMKSLFGTA